MANPIDADVDYYELLEVNFSATLKEITKAYRVKSLKVHPDKNPSPDAAAIFHTVSQAYDVLKDRQKRAAYDQLYKARLDRKKKQREMDAKRRAAQEELERRESVAKKAKTEQSQLEAEYEAELARLRAEGAKRRQEDWKPAEPAQEEDLPEPTDLDYALMFKWKLKKHDFTEKDLETLLNTIGKVDSVAISRNKKRGKAMVIFKTVVDAHAVITSKDSHSTLAQFDTIDWASGKEPAIVERLNREALKKKEAQAATQFVNDLRPNTPTGKPLFSSGATGQSSFFKNLRIPPQRTSSFRNAPNLSDKDFEAITLMKLRQAERERLMEQVKAEDDNSNG
ncbi:uncharacterized protein BYT42DRAFT_583544 [Radiomyces spectabilis]|uniref:uncharacterized protein n=1 Tax=Radiomyces spectabilis TaxID=64574 RepID=UPI002220B83B|nr:uncharacterized protein BYT42DRAFT_583544 [Radiomyces spectabilis]KAI8370738.1 hypothetical protein BYT42DRAFT_583544 [Radiomyces spectabilis]